MEAKRQWKSVDFELANAENKNQKHEHYENHSYWKDVWKRFSQNKGAILGLICIVIIISFAIVAPMISSHTYKSMIVEHASLPPRIPFLEQFGIFNGYRKGIDVYAAKGLQDVYYYFGTDTLGRDLWTRVWFGTRISLYIAFVAMLIDMGIGVIYGLISGYIGGRTDLYMQRFIEVLSGIPNLVIVTLLVLVLKPGILSITIALMITGWIGMSRLVRAQVLKLKEQEYILASKTLGASAYEIIVQDVMPNIMGQVITMSMFSIPSAIFTEAFLAFIGLGLQAPMASVGSLISDGYKSMTIMPHMVAFATIVLAILMLSFNVLADGLRDAFDPKQREM